MTYKCPKCGKTGMEWDPLRFVPCKGCQVAAERGDTLCGCCTRTNNLGIGGGKAGEVWDLSGEIGIVVSTDDEGKVVGVEKMVEGVTMFRGDPCVECGWMEIGCYCEDKAVWDSMEEERRTAWWKKVGRGWLRWCLFVALACGCVVNGVSAGILFWEIVLWAKG